MNSYSNYGWPNKRENVKYDMDRVLRQYGITRYLARVYSCCYCDVNWMETVNNQFDVAGVIMNLENKHVIRKNELDIIIRHTGPSARMGGPGE